MNGFDPLGDISKKGKERKSQEISIWIQCPFKKLSLKYTGPSSSKTYWTLKNLSRVTNDNTDAK